MHLLISPAKTLDMNTDIRISKVTNPPFTEESRLLINDLKKLSATDIQGLMKVSSKIAELNAEPWDLHELDDWSFASAPVAEGAAS